MKKIFLTLLLAISLLLQSCYQDEVVSESCLEINKISESSGPSQVEVGKTKEIIFKLSSSCDVDFFVTDSKIFGSMLIKVVKFRIIIFEYGKFRTNIHNCFRYRAPLAYRKNSF